MVNDPITLRPTYLSALVVIAQQWKMTSALSATELGVCHADVSFQRRNFMSHLSLVSCLPYFS